MIFIYLLGLLIFVLFINQLLLKKKTLINETGDIHQKFSSKSSVPLTGGIFIFLGYFFLNDGFFSFIFFSFIILILGILSDLKIVKSAKKKLLLQILFIISCVFLNDLQIEDSRINFLDIILDYQYINYIFVTFCILIVVNGSNFIDGMNTLCIGYYLLITTIIYYLQFNNILRLENMTVFNILIVMLLAFIMNLKNKFFLGDSGAYLIGFSFSILLINIYRWNPELSPFFIILLLWYPSYENLFSIFRKNILKRSAMYPDAKHAHQLIFFFIKKKYKLTPLAANIFTSQIINVYNFLIMLVALNFINDSKIQIYLIVFNVVIYNFTYLKLFKFKYKKI
jgi:UDP-N-acetylmuramyl pentapeptide phosphotransferase/UDP-N-acetylglucosamine-1-phosphate transferase